MIATRFSSIVVFIVAAAAVTACKPSQQADPLVGWTIKSGSFIGLPATDTGYRLDQTITADYEAYINALPSEEKAHAKLGAELYLAEDGSGQHAVKIIIPLKGTYWTHVLVYDKSDKRVKLIKYRSGKYAC